MNDPNLILLARVTALEQALMALISVLPASGATGASQISERTDALREIRDLLVASAGDHFTGPLVRPETKTAMRAEIQKHLGRLFDGLDQSDVLAATIEKYSGPRKQEH